MPTFTLLQPSLETPPQSPSLHLPSALGQVMPVPPEVEARGEREGDLVQSGLATLSGPLTAGIYSGWNDVEHCGCDKTDDAGDQDHLQQEVHGCVRLVCSLGSNWETQGGNSAFYVISLPAYSATLRTILSV